MASLQQLLAEEGFQPRKKPTPKSTTHHRTPDKSITLPIYICHNRSKVRRNRGNGTSSELWGSKNSVETDTKSLSQREDKSFRKTTNLNSILRGSRSEFESDRKGLSRREDTRLFSPAGMDSKSELEIDEVAVKAVVSILSGYIGKFLKSESFRETIRDKCSSCLSSKLDSSGSEVIKNIEMGMEKVERLVQINSIKTRVQSLSNSIRLLNIVASINSPKSKNGSTCGVPNSHLSACAEIYLSIVYRIEKKDRVCARHLLQVFAVSPFLARTHLLPELWERFFLPHLLHIKVWHMKEVEFMSNSCYVEKERRLKALAKAYNDQMDVGTKLFALYYKEWLKPGVVKAPQIPSVPLPSISNKRVSERRSSGSFADHFSINNDLYQAVFGPNDERRTRSVDLEEERGSDGEALRDTTWNLKEEKTLCIDDDDKFELGTSNHNVEAVGQISSSRNYMNPKAELWPAVTKSDYLRVFSCRKEPPSGFVSESLVGKKGTIIRDPNNRHHLPSSNFSNAVSTLSSSDVLTDCEIAIRVVTKAWLEFEGDFVVESSLSKEPVIEGMLEVLYTSRDDEILELAISILAELVSRNDMNRKIILNSDPQLGIFMRLLRNSSLFLKSSVLLYLLKPKAKQMISMDWVPLVLRVLEFSDQLQTLFTIRCSPQVAAFYLLEQLLTGFDVEINVENARKVVSLGGLSMLVRRLETGCHQERSNAALFVVLCIQADGSCRHYIANNVNKAAILHLLVLQNQAESGTFALSLLVELLCLNRVQATKFLTGLKTEGGCLNTMHVLLAYLQRAPLEHRPLVAAILLQLDLLGDHLQSSMYREEVLDAIIEALDCSKSDEKVQEQAGRALLLLGGRFSHLGKASVENWLLRQAGFDESLEELVYDDQGVVVTEGTHLKEEEEAAEEWLRKAAMVLLVNGNKRLLTALSESFEKGIPCLAHASLVTVAWISSSLHLIQDQSLQSLACSILVPWLLETLSYDRQLEERVLASLSLLSLVKISGCRSMFSQMDKDFVSCLRNLSLVTWTAEDLLSVVSNGSNHWYNEHEIIPDRNMKLGFE